MVVIGDAVIEDDVIRADFSCDLDACRGACCCLEGGRGAPLGDEEIVELERAFPAAEMYLPVNSRAVIRERGLWEGVPGDYVTPCIGRRECAYVWFDGPVARCSFERAYLEGRTAWRKPLSCHLFPIRIGRRDRDHVRYEQIAECRGGRTKGSREGIPLAGFLREPLIRCYGRPWYDELARYAAADRKGSST